MVMLVSLLRELFHQSYHVAEVYLVCKIIEMQL